MAMARAKVIRTMAGRGGQTSWSIIQVDDRRRRMKNEKIKLRTT
jgi:hypothetical protein